MLEIPEKIGRISSDYVVTVNGEVYKLGTTIDKIANISDIREVDSGKDYTLLRDGNNNIYKHKETKK